jgi:hypothetical protein
MFITQFFGGNANRQSVEAAISNLEQTLGKEAVKYARVIRNGPNEPEDVTKEVINNEQQGKEEKVTPIFIPNISNKTH